MNDVLIVTGAISRSHQVLLQNNTGEAIRIEPSDWVQHEPVSAGQAVAAHVISPGGGFLIPLRVRKKTVGAFPANHVIPDRYIDGGEGPQLAVIKLNNGGVHKKLCISLADEAWFGDVRTLNVPIDDLMAVRELVIP